jgi:enamine deaminase RidA (YjgF/YER057c/UK114 family)
MRLTISRQAGAELAFLSAEGAPAGPADRAAGELLARFDAELRELGLSLDNTIRTRLWGRDREARDLGSRERVNVLSGKRRSASSSFIAPKHFDSDATVAIDLVALKPASASEEKTLREYDPPIVPLRYLTYGGLAVLSGVTWEHGTLEDQLDNILPRIAESLAAAGSSWSKVTLMSAYLHRSQTAEALRAGVAKRLGAQLPGNLQIDFVDGYSAPGKLVELEVSATL